jgi:threonine aldolase
VTLPPPEMREAIARADLGDDVYGEDPTVNTFEARAAALLGKPAALLTTSGTMSNLLAIMAQCPRGMRALVGDRSDVWRWEAQGAAVLGSVAYQPVRTHDSGEIAIADLEDAIDDESDAQCAVAALICLENTHALCGGRVLALDYLSDTLAFAQRHRLATHLDGARLFNAAVALDVAPATIAAYADTVAVCISKGLAAPVGSILAGPEPVIARARRLRKMLGGGMRQAGVIAAAGLYALDHMVDRLRDDHRRARQLALGLRQVAGLRLDDSLPETNIVYWRLDDHELRLDAFLALLREEGVLVLQQGRHLRAVTHLGISDADVNNAVLAVARAVNRLQQTTDATSGAGRAELHAR